MEKEYRRLVAAFERIFGATIFFGTDSARPGRRVVHRCRFNFLREAQIWYDRDFFQDSGGEHFENVIVLSDDFYNEILAHPIPTDVDEVKILASAPAVLDLFMWLVYRCFIAKREEQIPLFGDFGLTTQLGSVENTRPRRFGAMLQQWLSTIRTVLPECPAKISRADAISLSRQGQRFGSEPNRRLIHEEAFMFPPDAHPFQTLSRVPLATIDLIVSVRLGTTRVKGNAQPAVFNRQIAMYLAKHVGGWSTTTIGKFYNGRHHTTVLWALHRIEYLRARDARIEGVLFSLTQEIQSRSVQKQHECRPSLSKVAERQLVSFGLDDEFLELLTDKIADRLKLRGGQ